jgi:chitinase
MKRKLIFLGLILCLVFPSRYVKAQTGTPHGVEVKWTAPVAGTDPNAIAGYNIYQCPGTCTLTSTWTKIDTSLDITTGYLVSYTGLTAGAVYSYAATAVDTAGNESAFSNIATVTIPTTPPSNPGAPTGCTATAQ